MRDYAKLLTRIWVSGPGKKYRGDPATQLTSIYLVSAPNSNMIGLYYLPISTIAHDVGIGVEDAQVSIERLIESNYCSYDYEREIVFIHEMASIQIGEQLSPNDKQIKGVTKEIAQFASSPLYGDFLDRYRDAFCLVGLEAPPKPLRSPLGGPPKPGSGSGSGAGPGERAGGQISLTASQVGPDPTPTDTDIDELITLIFDAATKFGHGLPVLSLDNQKHRNALAAVLAWARATDPGKWQRPIKISLRKFHESTSDYIANANHTSNLWLSDPGSYLGPRYVTRAELDRRDAEQAEREKAEDAKLTSRYNQELIQNIQALCTSQNVPRSTWYSTFDRMRGNDVGDVEKALGEWIANPSSPFSLIWLQIRSTPVN